MTLRSPTRAALVELQEERHAMHEGHVFLDEKCLLLAGEMLRQLERHALLERALNDAHEAARNALAAALARHGLQGLQVREAGRADGAVAVERSALMGVPLLQARLDAMPSAVAGDDSPELAACRAAFAALAAAAAPLAAAEGNLVRLEREYRRSVRRARALQDVLLPEVGREIAGIEAALDELEQQDTIAMRRGS